MPEDQGSLGRGILTGLALTVAGVVVVLPIMGLALGFVLNAPGLAMILGIGIVQVLWMLPAWLIYRRQGRTETAKGILIIAGVIFLLNASCWGLVFSSKVRIGG